MKPILSFDESVKYLRKILDVAVPDRFRYALDDPIRDLIASHAAEIEATRPALRKWSPDMANGLYVAFSSDGPHQAFLPGYVTVKDGKCFGQVYAPEDRIDIDPVGDGFLEKALFSTLIPWPEVGKDDD